MKCVDMEWQWQIRDVMMNFNPNMLVDVCTESCNNCSKQGALPKYRYGDIVKIKPGEYAHIGKCVFRQTHFVTEVHVSSCPLFEIKYTIDKYYKGRREGRYWKLPEELLIPYEEAAC